MVNKDQVKGKTKEAVGELTNDDKKKNEGKAQDKVGTGKEKLKDAKDSVKGAADGVKDSLTDN